MCLTQPGECRHLRHGDMEYNRVWLPDVGVDGSSARLSDSGETQGKTKRETELN